MIIGPGNSSDSACGSISEENFWRNYFYRVSLLRQGYELNAMVDQTESNPNQTLASTDSIDHTQGNSPPLFSPLSLLLRRWTASVVRHFTATWLGSAVLLEGDVARRASCSVSTDFGARSFLEVEGNASHARGYWRGKVWPIFLHLITKFDSIFIVQRCWTGNIEVL